MSECTHVPLKAPTGFFAPVTASCLSIRLVWKDLCACCVMGDRMREALGRERASVRTVEGRRAAMLYGG